MLLALVPAKYFRIKLHIHFSERVLQMNFHTLKTPEVAILIPLTQSSKSHLILDRVGWHSIYQKQQHSDYCVLKLSTMSSSPCFSRATESERECESAPTKFWSTSYCEFTGFVSSFFCLSFSFDSLLPCFNPTPSFLQQSNLCPYFSSYTMQFLFACQHFGKKKRQHKYLFVRKSYVCKNGLFTWISWPT